MFLMLMLYTATLGDVLISAAVCSSSAAPVASADFHSRLTTFPE